jgi:hypothetical protein
MEYMNRDIFIFQTVVETGIVPLELIGPLKIEDFASQSENNGMEKKAIQKVP